MVSLRFHPEIIAIALLILAAGIVVPALAAEGQITVGYQGAGWYYVGDTIVFNGMNSVGNNTLLKITGPGLPADGVPLYNIGGTAGSGNPAKFMTGTTWAFTWDTSRVDQSKLSSGKHIITVWDADHPEITSTTSIILKKPDFYMTATPSTARYGDYINLNGVAETGVSYVKINVTDASGAILHTFMSPVSATGAFSYSFHADMQPGTYTVTGMNPSMDRVLKLTLTITGAESTPAAAVTTAPAGTTAPLQPADTTPAVETTVASTTAVPVTTQAPISPVTPLLALGLLGAVALFGTRKKSR